MTVRVIESDRPQTDGCEGWVAGRGVVGGRGQGRLHNITSIVAHMPAQYREARQICYKENQSSSVSQTFCSFVVLLLLSSLISLISSSLSWSLKHFHYYHHYRHYFVMDVNNVIIIFLYIAVNVFCLLYCFSWQRA